jgi:phosphatidylglycerophosphatase A
MDRILIFKKFEPIMNRRFSLAEIIASCLFIGYVPVSSGTVASLIAAIVLFLLPTFSIITSVVVMNLLFFFGTIFAEQATIKTQQKDPSFIVIDEWFGMWLSLFLVPKNIYFYAAAFIIFRIFDIFKPYPIGFLEKTIPGGLGVMLDDACAGFFTLLIIQAICLFF